MSLGIISHSDCSAHNVGEHHPERPARIAAIQQEIANCELEPHLLHINAQPIKQEQLELAHNAEYIEYIFENAPREGILQLDADTAMMPESLNAALLSAGAATNAVDLVMSQEVNAAFCATRPPGHHAERDKAMGFCLFNNVAIAAIYAKQQYQLARVAVVDFDVHHGNGTENILRDESGFLFCSTFQHPFYPFSGTEAHPTHIINTPLSANAGSQEFRQAITNDWLPALHQFKPELLLISAGFDAHAEDNMSQVMLYEEDYHWVSRELKSIADQYSDGRIVSVLEGGYSLGALGRSVVAHLEGLLS
ncbi:histone deacetylase family protein [Aliikangiella coralliicola]|uniref:Histone deacetylase family protein n=1 Tax=Aliikangiella coralliicola TaxID=2592383 RepID=A0A545UJM5_9GAMM|nr:histone deacetylase family protein [Aliikangiella coralliicola]TQV89660.1 histone deacetylase family protein [Aliikangiella coralliicola]